MHIKRQAARLNEVIYFNGSQQMIYLVCARYFLQAQMRNEFEIADSPLARARVLPIATSVSLLTSLTARCELYL